MIKFDDPKTWPETWAQRCEIIAQDMTFRNKETGEEVKLTADQVFNSSPTGELWSVHQWFTLCVMQREALARAEASESPDLIMADIETRALNYVFAL